MLPYPDFYTAYSFFKAILSGNKSIVAEGSETWDFSHSINIVTLRPTALCDNVILCDESPCLTTNPAMIDNCNVLSINKITTR